MWYLAVRCAGRKMGDSGVIMGELGTVTQGAALTWDAQAKALSIFREAGGKAVEKDAANQQENQTLLHPPPTNPKPV